MYVRRHTVAVTTAADGSATAYTDVEVNGRVLMIQYVKDTFDNGVDFTITGAITGLGLWTDSNVNASETVAPRQPVHDQVGAALLFAAGGTAQSEPIYLAGERVKIVIAQGGNAKSGTFYITVG